ncbi:MAG: hypothetical protein ACOY99_10900 [Pseudomonadota bacterium]
MIAASRLTSLAQDLAGAAQDYAAGFAYSPASQIGNYGDSALN